MRLAARSFALYENEVVRAIELLKFERFEPLAKWFAQQLAEIYRQNAEIFTADVVVPVPLHRDREKERGHNQAELLSKPLAKLPRLPIKAFCWFASGRARQSLC